MNKAFVLALVLILIPARQSRADSDADRAERAVVMMEEIATIVDANKDNCDAMGDKLDVYVDRHAAELKKLHDAGKAVSAEQKKAFSEKYKDRMKAVFAKLAPGLTKCGANAKVKGAMAKASSPK